VLFTRQKSEATTDYTDNTDNIEIVTLYIYNVAEGSFLCDGATGSGIPPGTYRIELHPASADFPPNVDRVFNKEFMGTRSPLKVELSKTNSQNLIVDVGAKTVTAQ
jgi:hypothetical protein